MTPQDVPSADKRHPVLTGCASGLFILFLAQILFGGLLELRYSATAVTAYRNVQAMTGGFAMLRGFHYWSSAILIAATFGVMFWMVIAKWFSGNHTRMWLGVVLLFFASLLSQITGNLLPFDRHGVQTAVIEGSVARQMPVVGSFTAERILGGQQFNENTIGLWHMAHIAFFVLGLVGAVLFWKGSRGEEKNGALVWAPLVIAAVSALMVKAPLGNPASPADYGSFDAQVSWYTWPLHGGLNMFSGISPDLGWIGSGVIPGIFAALVIAAPLLGRKVSPKVVQGAFFALTAFFLIAAVGFGGKGFAPLTGNRDPAVAKIVNPVPASTVDEAIYAKGRELFNSKTCNGCHGTDGRKAVAGPDLLGVAKKRGNDPTWYMHFIKKPTSVKPNSLMPAFPNLKEEELRAMAEFLIHQK